ELCLDHGRWQELEGVARQAEAGAGAATEAAVLRARGHMARREFAAARALLEAAVAREPRALWPRVILSHCLLQDGTDPDAAERALRDVLALDPGHAEARRNLSLLVSQRQARQSTLDAILGDNFGLEHLYRQACRTPSDINEHLPALH